ncbi:MAG: kinase [Pseudomonadota bacterium]
MNDSISASNSQLSKFLAKHQLPDAFRVIARDYYLPLANELPALGERARPFLLGINGAQGTGKSTLADFLSFTASSLYGWNVAVLSIDDFYHTCEQRALLAATVHPLLRTRGVPGTHDMGMLAACLAELRSAQQGDSVALPRFDKARDDRANRSDWPEIAGSVDMIILEGWCVGTDPQSQQELKQAANALEEHEDTQGLWRTYANDQLKGSYADVFAQIDALVFLQAPGFEAIQRWRTEQEQKLAATAPQDTSGLMSDQEIVRFIQFYERLTRANLACLPNRADIVFHLNEDHEVTHRTGLQIP